MWELNKLLYAGVITDVLFYTSIIILLDHCDICSLFSTKLSLCVRALYTSMYITCYMYMA